MSRGLECEQSIVLSVAMAGRLSELNTNRGFQYTTFKVSAAIVILGCKRYARGVAFVSWNNEGWKERDEWRSRDSR
jgi:hypothetical protein